MCAGIRNNRGRRRAVCILASMLAATTRLIGFDFINDFTGPFPIAWNPGSVPIQLKLPDSGPLVDGSTYTLSVQAAINEWNGVLGQIQLASTVQPAGNNTSGNGLNEVVMTNTINGSAFAPNVLAVALTRVTGTTRAEGDVLFNTAWQWDSYRGPRANHPDRFDIRRVALHELGHVLGLDHPDEDTPPQSVVAIMNSRISNTLDALQADDIAGAQALYGAPGFVPANNSFFAATVITAELPAELAGTNVAANKEGGEPNHAGNAGGRSVWWRWTAPAVGSAAVTTTGSLFDTLLAVYTGGSVSSLTQVAANNDAGNGVRTSAVTFSTTAGTAYHIAVDGVNGDAAPLTLHLAFASGSTPPPRILRQPSSLFISPGGNVTLTVSADGGNSFQWLFNGTPIAGATGSSLTLTGADAGRAGNYQVQITNSGGTVTSAVAHLNVLASVLPNQTVTLGRNVSFTVPNSNNAVQWQFSTNGGASWNNVPNDATYSGGNSSQLTLTNATSAHHGLQFRYQLTGLGNSGSATSAPATLSVAPFLLPFAVGIAADGSGGFIIADTSDDVLLQVSFAGQVTTFAGVRGAAGNADGAAGAARFNDPTGIALEPGTGNFFVVDRGNQTIRHVTSAGAVTTLAGSAGSRGSQDGTAGDARFDGPTGIARAPDGTLYIADTQNHTIRRVMANGSVTTFAGSAGNPGDQNGSGSAARFNQPQGIASDLAGNLYVADTGNHLVRKITPSGEVTTLAGISGRSGIFDATPGTGALFNQPTGIAVGSDGNIYVTDVLMCFIRRISPDGAVFTIAGLTRATSQKDGVGRDAWFNQPRAIAAAGDALVIADTGNASLRRLNTDGTVTTIALSGTSSTPSPTPTPTPTPPAGGGGGGGGGAPTIFLPLATLALIVARALQRRKRDRN